LIDESGLLMAPLVRRTWAPRGETPQLYQRGRHREKVSLAIAFWVTPHYRRLGLYYETLEDTYFNNDRVAVFIEHLMRVIPKRMIVVWDRGNMHKGDPIRGAVERFHPRLTLEILPAYAPMLDPVEPIFSWLKYSRLCNFAPANAHELNDAIVRELDNVINDQQRLRNFWHASELPLPGS
jgi:transposase